MLRRIRTVLLALFGLLAFLLLTAVAVSVFYMDEVKGLMIGQLNKRLRAEVVVGDFDVSLLRHFPYASLEMSDVLIREVTENEKKDTLLFTHRISLLFNVLSFYHKDYTVKRVILSEGLARLKVAKNGTNNFEFWKSDTTAGKQDFDLSRVDIRDMDVSYHDKRSGQDYDALLRDVRFSGRFGEAHFSMEVNGDLFIERLAVDGNEYIRSKEAHVETGLDIDAEKHVYVVRESRIRVADFKLALQGKFIKHKGTEMDLRISAAENDLAALVSLLPEKQADHFRKFSSEGKCLFTARIKGLSSAHSKPEVSADFSIRSGKMTPPGSKASLHEIELQGRYSSESHGTLHIPSLRARLGQQPIKGDLKLTDFTSPYLELHAQTTVELAHLRAFLANDSLEDLSGQASLDIAFAGKVKEIAEVRNGDMQDIVSSGNVRLSNVSFRLKGNPLVFASFSGNLQLVNTDVRVEGLQGTISSSDFRFDGMFRNLIPFFLSPHQPTQVSASLSSSLVDLDELLANKKAAVSGDTAYKLAIDPRLTADLSIRIGKLKLRKFRAGSLSGNVHLEQQVLYGQELRFKAMQGDVRMNAVIDVSRRDSVRMSCNADLRKLDIRQLFFELENYGQEIMTDRHVFGSVTAGISFRSTWTNDLVIDPARVKATCDITIENGELKGFKPIQALSKYIRLADLNDIRFATLHNVISIQDRTISIPSMDIHSSALDLALHGTHDFDNNIDYHFQLSLSELLGNKYKQQSSTEFGEVEDDGLGHTRLFLSMTGTVDEPKISYDTKAVRQKLKQDVQQEKQVVKDLLREEFRIFKKDTVKKTTAPVKKKEELEIEW